MTSDAEIVTIVTAGSWRETIAAYTRCPGAGCGRSLIVAIPVAVASVALIALPRLTVKVSSDSASVSATIGMVIIALVAPAR